MDFADMEFGPPELKRARSEPLRRANSAETCAEALQNEFVHGTRFSNLDSILEEGLVAKTSEIAFCRHFPADGRVSGLSEVPEVLVVLDQLKMLKQGVPISALPEGGGFYSKGQVKQGEEWVPNTTEAPGTLRPWFFRKIVDNRGKTAGNILFLSKDAWGNDEWKERSKVEELPDRLLHATADFNLGGIMKRGIVPNACSNPNAEGRTGHASLFAGGEGHVNAVLPDLPGPGGIKVAGLDKVPSALVSIDVRKAVAAGCEIVQSPHRPDHFLIRGEVPPDCVTGAHSNSPVNLPKHLECKVVASGELFEKLPIIDLSLPREALVEKIRWACSVPGFMQVVGHKVDPALESKIVELQKRFFALQLEKKLACKMTDDSPVRGYFGRGGENLDAVLEGESVQRAGAKQDRKGVVDNKEGLDMNGAPSSTPGRDYVSQIFAMPSRLPAEEDCPGLRETATALSEQLMDLGKELLKLMSLALGKGEDFFSPYMTQPVATHRLLHYWPLQGDFKSQIGCGEHTDYGLLTILKQDGVGGLQVLSAQDMQWVMVPPLQGAYVVNLGDMLSQWTGNYFKSTIHRVVNTSNLERFSSPYFIEPNLDTLIKRGELHPSGAEKDKTAGEILHSFYASAGILKPHHGKEVN